MSEDICCNCWIKEASEAFNAWDCITKFDGKQESYRNYEPCWTLCQLPHNRRDSDGSNIRVSKAKISDSSRNEAQSPLRN